MSIRSLITEIFNKDKTYKINAAGVCHRGNVRENNEDNLYFLSQYLPLEHEGTVGVVSEVFSTENTNVVGVFDGMGGESFGELASYTAVDTFAKTVKFDSIDSEYIKDLFNDINAVICKKADDKHISQMGTTASMIFFKEDTAVVTNLGDSPMYLLQKDSFESISLPHTNEEWLKINNINRKPELTQFLGLDYYGMILEPYVKEIKLHKNDIYLVCSDGLTDMVADEEIKDILKEKMTITDKVEKLLKRALEQGGRDNITIILCEVK